VQPGSPTEAQQVALQQRAVERISVRHALARRRGRERFARRSRSITTILAAIGEFRAPADSSGADRDASLRRRWSGAQPRPALSEGAAASDACDGPRAARLGVARPASNQVATAPFHTKARQAPRLPHRGLRNAPPKAGRGTGAPAPRSARRHGDLAQRAIGPKQRIGRAAAEQAAAVHAAQHQFARGRIDTKCRPRSTLCTFARASAARTPVRVE